MAAKRDRRCLHGVGGYCFISYLCFCKFTLDKVFYICILSLHDERERRVARQRPAESWNRTEEAPTSTSTASASLWEREARDGRKWGDVETGRVGTAGRAKARKGDWAATWVPRQARNKTRDNNFRIPPPAHDVGGKDAEASMAGLGGARQGRARQGKARQRSYARDSG